MDNLIDLLRDVGATGLTICDAREAPTNEGALPGIVRIGTHRSGPLPVGDLDGFDILLSAAEDAPAPWVAVTHMDGALDDLRKAMAGQPLAAAVLAQVLRITLALDVDSALMVESLAYSALMASHGFRRWLGARTPKPVRRDHGPRVRLDRAGETVEIVLNRPRGRNAIDAAMRDALCGALEFAALDPDQAPIVLRGEGAVFSVGGDLAEFGRADDAAAAHAIRMLRSPARLLYAVRDRATAHLHGPCIGAGIEIPAAAGRLIARPRTSFRLPEVMMGVIPGAGGTATIPRRIGRQRACWMALSGAAIDLPTAVAWGLVDDVHR
ncbi:MAG: enoyl-CoA hydratase/isomerase family protein [Sphingomonadaceae bacterium]|nr:enoyl-CoA hydratase/isomerase family protein [Sphingomonadaceae bacterium]